MASNFDQPLFNWEASETFQEFQRFRQHVHFTFKGPLCKFDAKDKAGWIGLWIGQQGREIYKTIAWDEGEEDAPDNILDKLEAYVRPRKNKRVARFRAQQRKQSHGESFDNFVKDLRIILIDCEFADPDDIGGANLRSGSRLDIIKSHSIGRQYEMSQSQMKLIRGDGTLPVSSVRGKPTTNRNRGPGKRENAKSKIKHKLGVAGKLIKATQPAQQRGLCVNFAKNEITGLLLSEQVNKVDTWDEDHGAHSDNEIMHIIDTGAKCCIIVKSEFDILNVQKPLTQPSSKVLRSYSNHDIRPLYSVVLKVTNGSFARDLRSKLSILTKKTRGVKHLPQFNSGDFVRLQLQTGTKSWLPGTIVESHSPRSYLVDNGDSVVRRNRSHIRKSTEKANFTLPEPDINVSYSVESKPQPFRNPHSGGESVIVENARETEYVTKSGRVVKPPRKLDLLLYLKCSNHGLLK
ncbi:LOW QUALITY PROTEIN: hypothetical protein KUTeg_007431, partial [Tegillarca granosa]